jgi:hypothetical protein
MDTERLIDTFRSEVHDTAEPFLWTDDEVVSYLDRAQNWYCRLTGGIADSSSEATRIDMVAGEKFGVVSAKVLKFREMQRESDNHPISLWNFEDAQFKPYFENSSYYAPYRLVLNDQTGLVGHAVTGMEQGKVRWIYVPAEDDTAICIVYRLPLETLSTDNLAPLEIPEEDQEALLDGMKALAYKKEDAETFNKAKQIDHQTAFEKYCGEAKEKREKREHKYRTVRYGGL